jgi:hypothetical protein
MMFSDSPAQPSEFLPVSEVSIPAATDLGSRVAEVVDFVARRGFVFEPWQVAAFITAVRTKPFVILAGISGTGKSKLPALIAEATDASCPVIPVRPDWTDSGELLGFERLSGEFVPGPLLHIAREAMEHPEREHFLLLDEMNIARVEYYLAEVLTHIEERRRGSSGFLESAPLTPGAPLDHDGTAWNNVVFPSNLCLVGSVNMDETTHGFSRKVLDRSFVLEFSEIDLSKTETSGNPTARPWGAVDWAQPYLGLGEYPTPDDPTVLRVIATLTVLNDYLSAVQLQVGYRVRDEIALFCVHARECGDSFGRSGGRQVDPLDLAVAMKILPRLQGGGATIRRVLKELLAWAEGPDVQPTDEEIVDDEAEFEPTEERTSGDRFPTCAERLRLMIARHDESGFTSYWL